MYESIFAQMFPEAAQLKEITEGAREAKVAGIPLGALAFQFVGLFTRERAENNRTLILDDLERSRIKPEDLLGIINRYVEHHGCRVVVIAHEGKLAQSLLDQREKIFGQAIRVTADIDAAYDVFARDLEDPRGILQKHRAEIVHLFGQSEVESLRILRHVMEDTVRLLACLTDDQGRHADATRDLVKFVAALNLDVRFNRLQRKDLLDRRTKLEISASATKSENIVESIYNTSVRYTGISFESNILSDIALEKMLFDGVFDPEQISSDLANTPYFTPPKQLPDWVVVFNFQVYSDEIVQGALDRIEDSFSKRSFRVPGEMLHIFAIRLLMASKRVLPKSKDEVVDECKKYIDDLRGMGLLKSSPMRPSVFTDDIRNGYQQYGYWVEEEYAGHFNDLRSYLANKREEVLTEALPSEARIILEAVERSGTEFFSLINHTAAGEPRYGAVPVLAAIPVGEFVEAWLRSPVGNWYWIKSALDERLKHPSYGLHPEKAWTRQVIDLLIDKANNSPPLRAFRIRTSLPNRSLTGDAEA